MDRIIAIVLGIPVGFLLMIYRYQLKQFTGSIAWAEEHLGSGGTYNLFILIGLAVSILSLMYGLGTLQEFLGGPLKGIF
jgi:hypothetical protein